MRQQVAALTAENKSPERNEMPGHQLEKFSVTVDLGLGFDISVQVLQDSNNNATWVSFRVKNDGA